MNPSAVPSTSNVFGSLFSLNSSTASASGSQSSHWRQLDVHSMASILASKQGLDSVLQLPSEDAVAVVEVLDRTRPVSFLIVRNGAHMCCVSCVADTESFLPRIPLRMASKESVNFRTHLVKGRLVAIKVLKRCATDDLVKVQKRFCREALAWKRLSHPNVLPFLGVSYSPSQFWMVSVWMTHGDIIGYVKSNPEANRLLLLSDVASGLDYLHTNDLVHGDLKGLNILINNDYRACLADFGLMVMLPESLTANATSTATSGGTLRWMAPELLVPEEYGFTSCVPSKESDIYALGMVIYEVMTGSIPFYQHRNIAVIIQKVMTGVRPERPTEFVVAGLSDDLWQLVELCWHQQRKERPSIRLVLDHLKDTTRNWVPPSPTTVDSGLDIKGCSDGLSTLSDTLDSSPTGDITIAIKPPPAYGIPNGIPRETVTGGNIATVLGPSFSREVVKVAVDRPKVIEQDLFVGQSSASSTPAQLLDPTHPPFVYSPPPTAPVFLSSLERQISLGGLRRAYIEGPQKGNGHARSRKSRNVITTLSRSALFPWNKKGSSSLHERATAFLVQYKQFEKLEDLEEAISLYREALILRPHGHQHRSSSLNNLAASLLDRFRRYHTLDDLEEAIVHYREALVPRPSNDQYCSDSLNGLATSLVDHFRQYHKLEDIEEAIAYHREALALRPPGNQYRSDSLNGLAVSLSARFRRCHKLEDIEEAIVCNREALALHPPGYRYRSDTLNGIATGLIDRFGRLQKPKDLDEATIYSREALSLRPPGNPARSYSLNTIARVTLHRFERSHELKNLDEAIAYCREALDLVSPPSPIRCVSLNNLARAIHYRFERSQKSEDLEEAMTYSREALTLNLPGHLDWFDSLIDLAVALTARFRQMGRKEDLHEVAKLLSDADAAMPAEHLPHIQLKLRSPRRSVSGL